MGGGNATDEDDVEDEKKADSAFDDLVIEIDMDELNAESNGQPTDRKS